MSVSVWRPFRLVRARLAGLAAACTILVSAGCTHTASTAERIDEAYQSSGMKRGAVCPLAGRVTIDNEAPDLKKKRMALIVMACDASKPSAAADGNPYVPARADGSFEFPDGGVPPGKYVMVFALMNHRKKRGFEGPDGLKNLFNDPDVNATKPEFVVDLQAPGRKDMSINLNLAGEGGSPKAGPKALTHISN